MSADDQKVMKERQRRRAVCCGIEMSAVSRMAWSLIGARCMYGPDREDAFGIGKMAE